MVYKNADILFDVNSKIKRSVSANIQFSTQDIDTAKITFRLTKDGVPLPISKATHGKLFMRFADGSKFYVNTEVQDALEGVIFYALTPDQVTHYGTVQAELYVNYDNGQKMSVHKFSFEIDRALVDQDIAPVAEYYIEDFEDLKAIIVEISDDAEQMLAELQEKFQTLDNIETKKGAQEKADAAEAGAKAYTDLHASKTDNPHAVTKSQVGLANVDNVQQAAKIDFDSHVGNKSNPHAVTKAQVGLSNVDNVKQASKTDFDNHANNTTVHITANERTKWNGGQLKKISADDGGVTAIANNGEDVLEKVTSLGKGMGTFYAAGGAVNSPTPLANRGMFHFTSTDTEGKGTFGWVISTDYKNNVYTNYRDGNLGWIGWRRLVPSSELESPTWVNVTLKNGATSGDRTVQYTKVGNTLQLRGHVATNREVVFGSIPASFAPTSGAVVNVSVSGTMGNSKLIIYPEGDLKLTGIQSNNDGAVTGYYLDVVVPIN
ncbi:phage baseplate upper protein [Bacillus paralicheniformis]|uniref:phage baseplate upper protein n=1 Tax=Bacillus paralicheniformis TaxID=1648923 RepID=UPI003F79B399